jgi:hypothetical protein
MSAAPEYISLNATLRDLLQQCDELDVIDALIAKDPKTTGDGEGYRDVMATLLAIPPTPPVHPIRLSVYQENDDQTHGEYVDVALLNQHYVPPPTDLQPEWGRRGQPPSAGHYDAEAHVYQPVFGIGLTPWPEIIDSTLYADSADFADLSRLCPTLAHVLAEILWEITFYGYSDAKRQEVVDSLKAAMDEYDQAKADGTLTFEELPDDNDEPPRHLADGNERDPA